MENSLIELLVRISLHEQHYVFVASVTELGIECARGPSSSGEHPLSSVWKVEHSLSSLWRVQYA